MTITTKHNIAITIDDETLHIVVAELDPAQQVEMNKLASDIEAVNADAQRVASLMNDIETNLALIECVGLVEKAKLLWENKDLKKELISLQKSVQDANPEKMLSDSLMRRLELTISGEDKSKLMAIIKSKNIDPRKIVTVIGNQVAENERKK